MTKQADTDKKIASLIKMGEKALASTTEGHQKHYIDEKLFHDFRISTLSFFTTVFGSKSAFYLEFQKEVANPSPSRTKRGMGILEGARKELQGDWLTTVKTELYGKLERDLLGIARKHVTAGNLISATISATTLLENHLQQFASQNNLAIERKLEGKMIEYTAVQLNSRIYKKGLYPRALNKKIFKWLELGEKITTEETNEIEPDQILTMVDGIAALFVEFPINYLE